MTWSECFLIFIIVYFVVADFVSYMWFERERERIYDETVRDVDFNK